MALLFRSILATEPLVILSWRTTEIDVPRLMHFADRDVIQALRASSSSRAAEVAGRDPTRAAHSSAQEIKRSRQGLRKDELSSSDVLDVTVQLGSLARQTIHQSPQNPGKSRSWGRAWKKHSSKRLQFLPLCVAANPCVVLTKEDSRKRPVGFW